MAQLTTLYVVLAAFFWGLAGGIAGILISRGWEPFVIALYRGGIGLVFIFIWLLLSKKTHNLKRLRLWFWGIIAGLGVSGNFAFYFISIEKGGVAVAATLLYCAPVFVYLISFVLKLEKLSVTKSICIILVLIGIILLTRIYRVDLDTLAPIALLSGLLSGLCYAVFIFGFKYAAKHGSAQEVLTVAFLTLTLILSIPTQHTQQAVAAISSDSRYLFILIGVFGAGVSFFLYIKGLYYTPPAVASVIAMVEPVTASLVGMTVLDEKLVFIQYLGIAIILFTVTFLSIASKSSTIKTKHNAKKDNDPKL